MLPNHKTSFSPWLYYVCKKVDHIAPTVLGPTTGWFRVLSTSTIIVIGISNSRNSWLDLQGICARRGKCLVATSVVCMARIFGVSKMEGDVGRLQLMQGTAWRKFLYGIHHIFWRESLSRWTRHASVGLQGNRKAGMCTWELWQWKERKPRDLALSPSIQEKDGCYVWMPLASCIIVRGQPHAWKSAWWIRGIAVCMEIMHDNGHMHGGGRRCCRGGLCAGMALRPRGLGTRETAAWLTTQGHRPQQEAR